MIGGLLARFSEAIFSECCRNRATLAAILASYSGVPIAGSIFSNWILLELIDGQTLNLSINPKRIHPVKFAHNSTDRSIFFLVSFFIFLPEI